MPMPIGCPSFLRFMTTFTTTNLQNTNLKLEHKLTYVMSSDFFTKDAAVKVALTIDDADHATTTAALTSSLLF
jgi:hypothetical protein